MTTIRQSRSNYSGRFPRSLREAFGPYAGPYTMADLRRDARWDRIIGRLCGFGLFILLLLALSRLPHTF